MLNSCNFIYNKTFPDYVSASYLILSFSPYLARKEEKRRKKDWCDDFGLKFRKSCPWLLIYSSVLLKC